jgi:predicted lactoylglutathione lyase
MKQPLISGQEPDQKATDSFQGNDETVRVGNIENINGTITVSIILPKRFRDLTSNSGYSSQAVYNDIVVQLGASSVEPINEMGHSKRESGLKLIFDNKHYNKSSPLHDIFDNKSGKSPVAVITAIIDDHMAFTPKAEKKPVDLKVSPFSDFVPGPHFR